MGNIASRLAWLCKIQVVTPATTSYREPDSRVVTWDGRPVSWWQRHRSPCGHVVASESHAQRDSKLQCLTATSFCDSDLHYRLLFFRKKFAIIQRNKHVVGHRSIRRSGTGGYYNQFVLFFSSPGHLFIIKETKLLKPGKKYGLGRKEQPLVVNNKKISRDSCEFRVGQYAPDSMVRTAVQPEQCR